MLNYPKKCKDVTVLVPARAGSVSVKNKNLRKVKGRSLIQRAVDLGLTLNLRVVLTTNIYKPLPQKYGNLVDIHWRSENLSSSKTEMEPVLKDAIHHMDIRGTIVLLQPTSPLRTVAQLEEILEIFNSSHCTLCLSGVRTNNIILKNYIKINDKFLPISSKKYLFENRQMLPKVFHPNGAFYVFDAEDFYVNGFNPSNLMIYEMDEITSLDIDSYSDLRRVRKYAES